MNGALIEVQLIQLEAPKSASSVYQTFGFRPCPLDLLFHGLTVGCFRVSWSVCKKDMLMDSLCDAHVTT